MKMKRLIVSAPFGNYLGKGWATRTLGTFTLHPRPPGDPDSPDYPLRGGRLWRILRTVRYNPFKRAWRNKIGLRNPGIHSLDPEKDYSEDIISIHGFNTSQWKPLILACLALSPGAIELNLSCPNVVDDNSPFEAIDEVRWALLGIYDPEWGDVMEQGPTVIAKLPPPDYGMMDIAEHAWKKGIRTFHCCNTIPSPKGGISGKPLKPVALRGVRLLRERFPHATIIGGGGITSLSDADDYILRGADHVAVASCLFNPINAFWRMPRLARRLEQRLS